MTLPPVNTATDSGTDDTVGKAKGKAKARISNALGGVATTITALPVVGTHLIELDIEGQKSRVPMKCLLCDSPLATKEAKMTNDTKEEEQTGTEDSKNETADVNVETLM